MDRGRETWPMDAPEVAEIRTREEFECYTSRGGVIVIRDDANRSGAKRIGHLHTERKACSHVDVDHFSEKVLTNTERNGCYWWAPNSRVAERELGAVLCAESKKLLGRT